MLSPVDNFIVKFAYTLLPGNGIVMDSYVTYRY